MRLAIGRRAIFATIAMAVGLASLVATAEAQDLKTVKVGKAIISSFPFSGLDLGVQQGIWKSVGLDVQIVTLSGDAKLQQAFAAGAVDFGVGSGPGMGFTIKGVPAHAVAVIAYAPNNMSLVVSPQSGVKTIDDLKGKSIGVTTAGSLTDWLVRKIIDMKHWQPDDITIVPMGDARTRFAAMQSGQIAGTVNSIQEGYAAQDRGAGKVLMTFGTVVPHFYTHVIFARDEVIKNNPAEVKQFLKGWFRIANFMKTHRDETVESIAKTMNVSPQVIDQTYDTEIGMMSFDGSFEPQGMDTIRQSLKDLHILDTVPDASKIYDPSFVPVDIK